MRAFEDAFDVAAAVLRAFENASRTPGALFVAECLRKRIAYHRRLFCAPNAYSVP